MRRALLVLILVALLPMAALLISAYVDRFHDTVAAQRDANEVPAPVLKGLASDLAWVLLIAVACVAAALVIAGRITSRLTRLQSQAAAVGRGDLGPHAPVTGIAELVELSGAFRRMATDLTAARDTLRRANEELQGANVRLTREMADREQAEAQVRLLARFPSENPSPVLQIGKDLVLNYANAASGPLLGLWGVREGEPVPADIQETASAALASGKGMEHEVTAGGRIFSLMFAPVVEGGYVNAYGRDITDRVQAAGALRRTADDLARSNQDLEQFAYVASHDLQEPLRIVAGYLQLLERRYKTKLDADADELINFAVHGAQRMQDLINDLLAYSRVETRGRPFAPADCQAALDRAMGNLRSAVQESGAVITHGPLPTVTADAAQLVQLFQNLLSNAIKFRGPRPPQVLVWAEKRDGRWLFRVKDNGIGIDPQYAERIFVIFQRLHTRQEYPGTGIGLAICKRIVERHGGKIWVESKVGEGSTFCLTL